MRTRIVLAALMAGASFLASPGATAASEKVYTAPYEDGPAGGDEFNFVQNEPSTGTIRMGRLYVEPAVVSCGGSSAYAMHRVTHKVTSAVSTVRVDFADALSDGYTWVALNVRDSKGTYLGSAELRGPFTEGGSVATLLRPRPKKGTVLTIDAGLRMSSSCPGAGGGMVRLAAIAVS